MPKNLRRPDELYLEAHQHAFAWAEKAIVLRSKTGIAEATAAANHARRWLIVIKALELQEGRSEISYLSFRHEPLL
jgi:hypothetical protein